MVNIENLIRLATLVRDETANKQNTALRVGGTFLEVVYAIRSLLETVGELDTLAKGLNTRTRFFHGSFADVDALKNKTDLGVYVATTGGWTGLLSVQFDFYSTVSQVALSSSTPDYSEGSLAWKPAPCVMFRTYTNGAWSQWRKAGADVVNDLVTGGKDKALSAEQGKVLKEKLDDIGLELESLSYLPTKYNNTTARLLAAVLRKVAFVDTTAQDSANSLIAILEQTATLTGITATYIGGTKYTGDSISTGDFSVVARYNDGSTAAVTATSVSPSRLSSTTTNVTVTYGGQTDVVAVTAIFNEPVSISNISSTQNATEGDSVDLSAITYTLTYANGNSVEMSDPNIITASPTTLVEGTNTITIALADYPSISGTLTINAGGAVTSAYVEKTFTNAANTSSGLLTFPSPMTVTPTRIVITNPATAGSSVARLRGATLIYDSQTDKWGGTAHYGGYPDTNAKTLTDVTVALSGDEGSWTGATISNIQFDLNGSTYTLQFRGDYTFTFTSETSAT